MACLLAWSPFGVATARVAPILIEACRLLDTASKRVECMKAADATDTVADSNTTATSSARRETQAATPQYAVPSSTPRTSGGQTCYTGPRGGTYTITASGKKNYGGC